PVCGINEFENQDDWEDISHGILTLQFPFDDLNNNGGFFGLNFLSILHNTFTQNIISQYFPNSCSVINSSVDGDDFINYQSGQNCNGYYSNSLNNDCKELILAYMPLYKLDNTNSIVTGNVYEIIMNFIKNSCIDSNFSGIT
ncbi:MAG: hypothetical protein ACK4ON_12170, partial [Bacteroidia bacterium]